MASKAESKEAFVTVAITQPEYALFKATDIEPLIFIKEIALKTVQTNNEVIARVITHNFEDGIITQAKHDLLQQWLHEVMEMKT